jgi:hypothetical protein
MLKQAVPSVLAAVMRRLYLEQLIALVLPAGGRGGYAMYLLVPLVSRIADKEAG